MLVALLGPAIVVLILLLAGAAGVGLAVVVGKVLSSKDRAE